MSIPTFQYSGAVFTYQQQGTMQPSTVTVSFIPLGGQDYGVVVYLDGHEIDRYRHSGQFTSHNAAQYAMEGVTAWMKETGSKYLDGPKRALMGYKGGRA